MGARGPKPSGHGARFGRTDHVAQRQRLLQNFDPLVRFFLAVPELVRPGIFRGRIGLRDVVPHSGWTARTAWLPACPTPVVVVEEVDVVDVVDVDALVVGVHAQLREAENVAHVFVVLVAMLVELFL